MIDITEKVITKNWSGEITPLVTICCATYNHENYIGKAIDGFLIQKTDFPFEVIVRDDCSTDKTADIVREYAEKYPRIIRSIVEKENQYSHGVKPILSLVRKVKSEYLAICDGDDYWLDRNKLQIQIDFLKNNQNYVVSGHDAFIVDENGDVISDSKLPDIYKRDIEGEELIRGQASILTLSMVCRNIFNSEEIPIESNFVRNGDSFLTSILGRYGKSRYHSDILPGAYCAHPGGLWSMVSREKQAWHTSNTNFWLQQYYERIGDSEHAEYYRRIHKRSVARQVGFLEVSVAKFLKVKRKLCSRLSQLTMK